MGQYNWKKQIIRFLTAQTVSLFGSSLVQYAIIWHITLTESSGSMLTIATVCGFAPQIIISLFAGVWIDRHDRKRIIMLSDTLIATATLILAMTFLAGYQDYRLLFLVLIIRSAGTGVQTPAVNAFLPQIVPKEHLMRVNGINSTLSSAIMILSPAVSGMLLSIAPFESVLFVDVVTALIGVLITATVRSRQNLTKQVSETTRGQEIRDGFRYLKQKKTIRNLLIYQIILLFVISPSAFLTPLLVSRTFGAEVWKLSAGEMTYSLGMVLGGLLISFWGGFEDRMKTTLTAGIFYGVIMIGLGSAPLLWIYLGCNMLIGITAPCYNAPATAFIQEQADPAMHGRIFSLMQIATSAALPAGILIFGPLADRIEIKWVFAGAGIIAVLVSSLAWRMKIFREK